MVLQVFTLVHILISLLGIAAGFGTVSGMLAGRLFPRWCFVFLIATIATSVTGFFFPFKGVTPGIVVGVISLISLLVACFAWYIKKFVGPWRRTFVVACVASLYLNVFVLIAQLFQKNPALVELSPGPAGLPFALTQGAVFLTFCCIGVAIVRNFDSEVKLPI